MTAAPPEAPARVPLATLPTPLVRLPGLEEVLGVPGLWAKRDDLTGFGVAGNKARPLELLVGDAARQGCDVIVAGGSASSNFCAAAAMAARLAGLDCDLLFPGAEPAGRADNIALARAAGARLHFHAVATREELDDEVGRYAATLAAQGRRPYPLPRGGATPVGAVAYALAVTELVDQCTALGVRPSTVVVAAGSGGTQAGLVAGTVAHGRPWRLVGASVSRPPAEVSGRVLDLARGCAAARGSEAPGPADVHVRDARGPGFGIPSERDRESAALALRHAGLLLDPYYGAKAMTVLRDVVAERPPGPVVFWHTGGVSAALAALAAAPAPAADRPTHPDEGHRR